MIIKKFTEKTEEEALAAAQKELGDGVVVMNVKSVKGKGPFAFLKPKMIEMTVALEDEREAMRTVRREAARTEKMEAARTQTGAGMSVASSQNIEKKLDSLQTLLEDRMKQEDSRRKEEELAREAASAETQRPADEAAEKPSKENEEGRNTEQEKFLKLLYNAMIDNEVDERYANQILEETEHTKKPNVPIDYILANVYQKMILKFGKSDGITAAEKNPRVVFFIGPTGVGKTTTIAKIASSYSVDEKKKVALLTLDTYRIAAAEQLRTYANILEVPFRVIYTEEELKEAIADFAEYDYIFVDTAGHSHQNAEQLGKMKELLQSVTGNANRQVFLVLSATTKYRDLLKIAENYKTVADYQLIFTKLDETTTLGNLLNLKLYTDAPIAYVTYGQNVPDDIERFNPQKTVKQLLGGKA